MASALSAAKKQLRSLMKAKLASIPTDSINLQSHRIAQTVTDLPHFRNAQRIGVYLSMPGGEVQTDAIVRKALLSGKEVFVPYLVRTLPGGPASKASVTMEMVSLFSLPDYESLEPDRWGIPSIDDATANKREWILSAAQSSGLDLILVPGVAFELDPKSNLIKRLGHGKGFYDFFLHQYNTRFLPDVSDHSKRKPLLYGLALQEQYLTSGSSPSLPTGEHDCLLHGLITGDGNLLEAPI